MTLKSTETDKAIQFPGPRDPWTDDPDLRDPNIVKLEALLASHGVHPNEIRGFEAERNEALGFMFGPMGVCSGYAHMPCMRYTCIPNIPLG
jgi:hypothetical protein